MYMINIQQNIPFRRKFFIIVSYEITELQEKDRKND